MRLVEIPIVGVTNLFGESEHQFWNNPYTYKYNPVRIWSYNLSYWYEITTYHIKTLSYLRNIIRDYFQDRVVFVQMASGTVWKEMMCGVLQGPSARTTVVEFCLRRHPEGGSPTRGKCHVLRGRYPGGYGGEQYPHARAEGNHHSGGYDPLDRVGWAEPSNCEDGSGAVYTLS